MTMSDQWLIDIHNPLIRDHRVLGQHLLPGLAYIDLLFQVFRDRGYDFRDLELRNLSIYRPLVITGQQSELLDIQCDETTPGHWRIKVEGYAFRDGTRIGEARQYITAEMRRAERASFRERLDVAQVAASACETVELEHLYAQWRQSELVHGAFMQATGRLYLAESAVHVMCELSEAARPSAAHAMFHPVLIDASATCGGGATRAWHAQQSGQEQELVLPLFYESFRASELLQEGCTARIQRGSIRSVQELRYYSMDFFDATGKKVAELRESASKLVREPSLIDPGRATAPAAARNARTNGASPRALRAVNATEVQPSQRHESVIRFLQALLAERLHESVEQIDPTMGYFELGITSAALLELVQLLEMKLGVTLAPTLLFEYVTIEQLARHLAERFPDAVSMADGASDTEVVATPPATLPAEDHPAVTGARASSTVGFKAISEGGLPVLEDVAIVGMAGRFPAARNIREYWENLNAGKDCITEVPSSRWDWRRFDALRSPSGKPLSRWGGFIEDVDCFDTQFFHVSPREAEALDPQERLFLQTSWEAIEDAGYTPATLVAPHGTTARRPVGVFVGVMHKDYTLIANEALAAGRTTAVHQCNAPIANRVSYQCNFHGPSMAIDTVCSSSLVAVHLAIQSLRTGECEAALAGGVNVSLHPAKYITYGMQDMHASDGRCHTFGAGGDGYVSSEAVAAVVLKPLTKALADGDHIYAVIKSSGTNHVGAGSGIAVPSPVAQADLITSCMAKANVAARSVGYVEAHGTGTSLGDPIEMHGLVKAFAQATDDTQFCAIGSAKSLIGHAESAAGICGLIKVALQLQHRALVPSLHSQELNPQIDWKHTPFFLQRDARPWAEEITIDGGREVRHPRRAAISSFGATGSNAHLLLEEYVAPSEHQSSVSVSPEVGFHVVPLSATDTERLREYATRLLAFLNASADEQARAASSKPSGGPSPISLPSVAYTLQVGRKALKARVAFVVNSLPNLREKLAAFAADTTDIADCYRKRENTVSRENGPATRDTDSLSPKERLARLAQSWVNGLRADWPQVHEQNKPLRVSLPTYPFAKERHWIEYSATAGPSAETSGLSLHRSGDVVEASLARTFYLKRQRVAAAWHSASESPLPLAVPEGDRVVLLPATYGHVVSELRQLWPEAQITLLDQPTTSDGEDLCRFAREVFGHVHDLLKAKPRRPVLVQLVIAHSDDHDNLLCATSGLLKTAHHENPRFRGQVIEVQGAIDTGSLIRLLDEDAAAFAAGDEEVRRSKNLREVLSWRDFDPAPHTEAGQSPWKNGGVYLVTGGAGGLGLILAQEIATRAQGATILLVGRSAPNEETLTRLRAFERNSARLEYLSLDVTDPNAVDKCINRAVSQYGKLNGVLHSAGVLRDNFIIRKSAAEFQEVLAPKVWGLINLDRATRRLPLDHFIIFSSLAGVLGNAGQSDYATANALMDRYAAYRHRLVANGERSGRTISMAWPLWESGGMQMDDASKQQLQRNGHHPLPTGAGIEALYRALASDEPCVAVLHGERTAVDALLTRNQAAAAEARSSEERAPSLGEPKIAEAMLRDPVLHKLKGILSTVTKFGVDKIDAEEPLESYGIDSLMILRLNEILGESFGELSKTLFFEYPTLSELCAYLVEQHQAECVTWTGARTRAPVSPDAEQEATAAEPRPRSNKARPVATSEPYPPRQPAARRGIAVIGLSGRYPMARNVHEFWEHLKSGDHCIQEVPRERWPLAGFYEADVETALEAGMSYSKWGGFLEGFAEFDPRFFGISPREAATIDPQERLFMQASWEVLEDAGYTRESLAKRYHGRVGVYVGVTKTGFNLYGPLMWRHAQKVHLQSNFSSVANRVSYLLDLHGPSIPFDTMCSASLTAVHEACEHLLRGECEVAIAGGVNLYLHPSSYVSLSAARMLSASGECRSFGAGADGFVPGEGVGALLLKPLDNAIEDGDHIYGVIRASSINHGGKTNGYTVPNPNAQRELIAQAQKKANLDPRAITYIEAHGTGTSLGDPIEIAGLTQAFTEHAENGQYCAIGSVKSNIGHLESAAGIAGLTKILLQLKHRQLVPSLHAEALNPHIDFARTPFQVQTTLGEWKRPVVDTGGLRKEYPRIAGVSSFGAGGANAHVIVEEYVEPDPAPSGRRELGSELPAFIVLSAKTEERLRAQAEQLRTRLSGGDYADAELPNIAYTLQVGREAMEHRLAFTGGTLEEVQQKLSAYLAADVSGQTTAEGTHELHRGDTLTHKAVLSEFGFDEDAANLVKSWLEKQKYAKVLELWVNGLAIDWGELHAERLPRVSLPTYPFARERYWLPTDQFAPEDLRGVYSATPAPHLDARSVERPREDDIARARSEDEQRSAGVAFLKEPSTGAPATGFVAHTVRGMVAEQLGMKPEDVGLEVNLGELGFDSIALVQLRHALERQLGIEIPLQTFEAVRSVDEIGTRLLQFEPAMARRAQSALPESKLELAVPRQPGVDTPGVPLVSPDPGSRYEPFPLADIQEAYLVGRQLSADGGDVGAHIYLEYELPLLDIHKLNAAWNVLIARHEMLRAVHLRGNQQKIQCEVASYRIKVKDLRHVGDAERQRALERTRQQLLTRVYDPKVWPQFDIRISACPTVLVMHFSIDEFVVDAKGLALLLYEWSQLYEDPSRSLPPLSVSFRDVLLAQKAFEGSARYQRDLEYWVAKLAAPVSGPVIAKRAARVGQAPQPDRGRLSATLPAAEWLRLKQRAEQASVSPTVLVLTAFGEVLRGWSDNSVFSLVMTYFNRLPLHPQIHDVVGPFTSTGIFVIGEDESPSLSDLMRSHQSQLWADLDHSSVSGVRVLRELKVRRRLSGVGSLPVVFTSLLGSLTVREDRDAIATGLFQKQRFLENHTPQVYLDHQLSEVAGELHLSWDVARESFGGMTLDLMFGDYCEVLRDLARHDEEWTHADLTRQIEAKKVRALAQPEMAGSISKTPHAASLAAPIGFELRSSTTSRYEPFPLTDQQHAYAFGRGAHVPAGGHGCVCYHEFTVRKLDVTRLERSWQRVTQAHPMLAARVFGTGKQQLLAETPLFHIEVADLRDLTQSQQSSALAETKRAMSSRKFELGGWPYFDLRVSLTNNDLARLHFSIDMLIADGTSIAIVLQDLWKCYSGVVPAIEPQTMTYRDYVMALQQYRSSPSFRTDLSYWEEKFAKLPGGPAFQQRSQGLRGGGARQRFSARLSNWMALKASAKRKGVAPNAVLLAVYMEVLSEWNGAVPFSVVLPVWQRLPLHPDLRRMVGDFTSMCWIASSQEPHSCFVDKVPFYQRTMQEDLAHQAGSGLVALRKTFGKRERDALLFPVVFTDLIPDLGPEGMPPGFERVDAVSQTPHVHLDNISSESGETLELYWDVESGAYPAGMVEAMFAAYSRILQLLADDQSRWHARSFAALVDPAPAHVEARYAAEA